MRVVLSAIALLGIALVAGAQQSVQVRDSRTGVAVPSAVVTTAGHTATRMWVQSSGVSDEAIEVSAPNHRPLITRSAAAGDAPVETTFWLDPVTLPPELEPAFISSRVRPGMLLLYGHVVDSATAVPIEGAQVRVAGSGAAARSDARGYFSLLTPAGGHEAEQFTSDDVVVEKEGYARYELRGLLLHEGDAHAIIELPRGEGVITRDAGHKLAAAAAIANDDRLRSPQPQSFGGLAQPPSSFAVPQAIRVGFDCPKATTCTRVGVYSLETYVSNGLDDEWIPSWPAESLKAGAVAYRSYGAWHILHPRTATYDICATTSCQVNKPETTTSSAIAAAAATRGVLAVNAAGTEPFFAEYSAHNNNKCSTTPCTGGGYTWTSCGDGYCGRPPEWPCLADPVETGYTLAGHGGGMSQWGSYRWNLQGKEWRWIVDHYYNDNGHPAGARSAPMNAAITVLARNGADEWQGEVEFTIGSTTGTAVPFTMSGAPGTYALAWARGGPSGATFTGVSPSAELEVASGDSAVLTLQFIAQCTAFTLSEASVTAAASAGSIPITITGSPEGCSGGEWSATALGTWLTVSPSSGTGPGGVTLSWTANASYARSGTAAIAGKTIVVAQSGSTAAPRERAVKRK